MTSISKTKTALKPHPLKIDGRIVPLIGSIDDPTFKFGMHPSEIIEHVEVSVIGKTTDIKFVTALSGADVVNAYNYIAGIQSPLPPHRTIYLDIQSVNYKRPEMQHYPQGDLFKSGSLELQGVLLSDEPEQTISLTDLIKYLNLNRVREVDYASPDGIGHERIEGGAQ